MKIRFTIICSVFLFLVFITNAWSTTYRGVEFPEGEISFADAVVSYTPGDNAGVYLGYPPDPSGALGVPDFEFYIDPYGWPIPTAGGIVWLGDQGELVLEFTDNSLTTSGDNAYDLWVFEIGWDEPIAVSISTDGINWIDVGVAAGLTAGIDIDAYIGSGVISGEQYSFVKLTDLLPSTTPYPIGGADIDAVGAISSAPPVPELTADAGENISIYSEDVIINIYGAASYTGANPLEYKWLFGGVVLLDWTPAGENNECPFTADSTAIPAGTYQLTLEVGDGQILSSDTMILTILNSAPHAAVLEGPGTYQIGSDVFLSSEVSDFDGDILSFVWKEGPTVISDGDVQAVAGGTPVLLPECTVYGLDIGTHYFTLEVSDGFNDTVSIDITVEIVDTQEPTLAPVLSKGILWPPNHQMVDITIDVNASDTSGLPITLSASIACSEPVEGLGDGDMFPDWTNLEIDQEAGVISLQLRAERSGSGDGREYTIIITATDASGNSSTVEKIIIVPHDKSKK